MFRQRKPWNSYSFHQKLSAIQDLHQQGLINEEERNVMFTYALCSAFSDMTTSVLSLAIQQSITNPLKQIVSSSLTRKPS